MAEPKDPPGVTAGIVIFLVVVFAGLIGSVYLFVRQRKQLRRRRELQRHATKPHELRELHLGKRPKHPVAKSAISRPGPQQQQQQATKNMPRMPPSAARVCQARPVAVVPPPPRHVYPGPAPRAPPRPAPRGVPLKVKTAPCGMSSPVGGPVSPMNARDWANADQRMSLVSPVSVRKPNLKRLG